MAICKICTRPAGRRKRTQHLQEVVKDCRMIVLFDHQRKIAHVDDIVFLPLGPLEVLQKRFDGSR